MTQKNEEALRPRNVTKLLFINMSGQETNFGQMECLKLITGSTLIEKRIGYLGLTQLFHEKSELLMMATNRIRVDLAHSNNNLVGLALCVLSEVCTVELATELHKEVLKVPVILYAVRRQFQQVHQEESHPDRHQAAQESTPQFLS
jgi:AP-1 complex subunit gamma-1